jgi:hypothetical protein
MVIDCPLDEQVESYAAQGHLLKLMEQYKLFNRDEYCGQAYNDVVSSGHIPVCTASDDAPTAKTRSNTIYPVFSFPLSVPPNFRHRFQFIHSIYCGKKSLKPDISFQHKAALEQFRTHNSNPVTWTDGKKESCTQ